MFNHVNMNNYPFYDETEKSISRSSESDQLDEDYLIFREVFNEPRHLEEIKGHDEIINQNWRTKERVIYLFIFFICFRLFLNHTNLLI